MDAQRYAEVFELFRQCLALGRAERQTFLERQAADDPSLRAEVEQMLELARTAAIDDPFAKSRIEGRLGPLPIGIEAADEGASLVGERLGSIVLERELGRGGMGTVYLGRDERLERNVAVKAIGGSYRQSADARARFAVEARALSQLEHPNVCRLYDYVETARHDFLVLELIEGHSLADLLHTGELGREERLRIALEVANALGAAHANGVIHRDVKPENVMVGADGVTRVLDFGVAFRAASGAPASADGAGADPDAEVGAEAGTSSRATAAGTLVGTPRSMSPEQARGEEVTTASDLYSFGLLLQELLTDQPPHPHDLELVALVHRAREARSELPVGLPADETALITELRAAEPAARPTAAQAAERLRRILGRPKRRRRQALFAATGTVALLGAVKYTLDLRHERGLAVAAGEVADQRREQAESLIDFMLGDLREKLTSVGKLEILDDVGDEALRYFAAVPEDELSRAELARRSQALYQIGEVRIEQAGLEEALEAFAEALTLAQRLVDLEPKNTDWLFTLGNCHFWVGAGHYQAGRLDEALAGFEAYRAVALRLVELEPDNLEWRMEVAHGEGNVAQALEALGRDDEVLEALRRRVAIIDELLQADPDRDDWRAELATTAHLLAIAREKAGMLPEAIEQYRTAVETLTVLHAADPEAPGWREQLALLEGYLAGALELAGERMAAREANERSLALARDLVRLDGENAYWLDLEATAHEALARADRRAGHPGTAREHARIARATYADLAAKDPERARWRVRLANLRVEAGKQLAVADEWSAALAEAEAACALMREVAALEKEDKERERGHADALLLFGDLLDQQGRSDEARTQWDAAFGLLEGEAESHHGALARALYFAALRTEHRELADTLQARLARAGVDDPRISNEVVPVWH